MAAVKKKTPVKKTDAKVVPAKVEEAKSELPIVPNEEEQSQTEAPADENEEYVEATQEVDAPQQAPDTNEDGTENADVDESKGSFTKEALEAGSDNGGKTIKLFITVIILTMAIAGGGMFLFGSNLKGLTAKPTPTVVPTEEPTPTIEEINLSQYTIEVLNGSGTSGAAAKAQAALSGEGFNVESIGNADENIEETAISVKEEVSEEFLDKLKEVLNKDYALSETTEELDDSENTDIVITIGSSIN